MDTKIQSIDGAELYFILPINNTIEIKTKLAKDPFLKKLISVQNDEFTVDLCKSISRNLVFNGKITYKDYTLPLNVYISNYKDYNSSIVYLKVSIQNPINFDDFLCLINGKSIIYDTYLNGKPLYEFFSQYHVNNTKLDDIDIFLFVQLTKTNPEFPGDYDEGIAFIEKYKQNIHQILLRSDTSHNHLRIDNHQSNFKSIANFYGTIDLCSPIALIQFYQHPINSLREDSNEMGIDHRACWWLVLTDMIFIQKSVLADTLSKIDEVELKTNKKTIKATTQIGKVLINMKDFWYFEDMTHELSKAVMHHIKEKIGVTSMLNSVLERVEYLENMVLREINEKQNQSNFYLNIILFIIAMIEIIPILYGMLNSIFIEDVGFSFSQAWLWLRALIVSLTLPFLIYILAGVRERKFTSAILAVKKTKTKK